MKRITNQRQIPRLAGYDEENNGETFYVFPAMINQNKRKEVYEYISKSFFLHFLIASDNNKYLLKVIIFSCLLKIKIIDRNTEKYLVWK